jgi:hypothetical protein
MIERWGEYTQPELVWKGIPGFFDFKNVYDRVAESAQDGQVFVEVGCLLGRSACYLGERIQARKKKVTLICVDAWPSTYHWGPEKNTKIEAPFETFLANVRQSGLTEIIFPIRAKSVRAAASIVRDNLDFVFIDAEHDYESCRDDIAAWLPKVRDGGTIAGHDYDDTFPGVVQAVNGAFGKVNVVKDGRCWICPVKK